MTAPAPAATKVLHYPGNRVDVDPDSFIGGGGRFFRPIPETATYNPATDQTAIEYVQVPMHEMEARYGQRRDAMMRAIEVYGSQW